MLDHSREQNQLQLGSMLLATLTALLVFSFTMEGTLRLFIKPTHYPVPTVTFDHPQMGEKLSLLENRDLTLPPVNCLILGSSLVHRGFDPVAFAATYYGETGKEIECFNMGLQAFSISQIYELSQFLIKRYAPRYLIFGTSIRDYSNSASRIEEDLLANPWIRYQMGDYSVEGFLLDKSILYRYFFEGSHIYRFGKEDAGFHLFDNGFDPHSPREEQLESVTDNLPDGLEEQLSNYQHMTDADRAALANFMASQSASMTIVVVEMPLPPGYIDYMPQGQESYDAFLDEVRILVTKAGGTFIEIDHSPFTDTALWYDWHHLNRDGAILFSEWLAEEIVSLED